MSAAPPRSLRYRRFFGALAFALSLGVAAAPTRADDAAPKPADHGGKKTSSLSWTRLEGAESCIGTHDLAQRVEALLHRQAIVSAADADLSIEGRVEKKSPKGFRSTIVVAKSSGDIVGKREIASDEPDCRALDEPVSLAMALMIDPEAALGPAPAPEPPKPVEPPKPPEPKVIVKEHTVYVPVPTKPAPKKRPYRFEGYVSGAAGLGITPFGGGVMTGAVLDPPWFVPFEVNGSLLLAEKSTPSFVPLGETKSRVGTIRFWQVEGSAYVCPLAGFRGLFQGALCAGGQAGFLASSGSGFVKNDASLRPLVNGALRGRIGIWAFPFSFTVGATFSVPLIRDTFLYRDASGADKQLFRSAPVAGMFDLSIGFKFPDPSPR